MRLLARWIYSYPDYFLKDAYLKYLGWMINDKDDGVRNTRRRRAPHRASARGCGGLG